MASLFSTLLFFVVCFVRWYRSYRWEYGLLHVWKLQVFHCTINLHFIWHGWERRWKMTWQEEDKVGRGYTASCPDIEGCFDACMGCGVFSGYM